MGVELQLIIQTRKLCNGSLRPRRDGRGALRFIAGWQRHSRKRLAGLEARHRHKGWNKVQEDGHVVRWTSAVVRIVPEDALGVVLKQKTPRLSSA